MRDEEDDDNQQTVRDRKKEQIKAFLENPLLLE